MIVQQNSLKITTWSAKSTRHSRMQTSFQDMAAQFSADYKASEQCLLICCPAFLPNLLPAKPAVLPSCLNQFACQTCCPAFLPKPICLPSLLSCLPAKPFACQTCCPAFLPNLLPAKPAVLPSCLNQFACQTCCPAFLPKPICLPTLLSCLPA